MKFYGNIPLPAQNVSVGPATPIANNFGVGGVVLDFTSYPKLGVIRKLISVNAALQIAVSYRNSSTTTVTNFGTPTTALVTFTLYKNSIPVYTNSASVDLETILGTIPASVQFENYNTYGIYADFVNPIPVTLSDVLSFSIVVAGYDLVVQAPETTTTAQWVAVNGQMILNAGGYIGYIDTDEDK